MYQAAGSAAESFDALVFGISATLANKTKQNNSYKLYTDGPHNAANRRITTRAEVGTLGFRVGATTVTFSLAHSALSGQPSRSCILRQPLCLL